MIYKNIIKAKFIKRVNRFIAEIKIEEKIHFCHVKNTGRCKELFVENADIYVQENFDVNRKTKYSLISIYKNDRLINIDSQIPNQVVFENIKNLKEFKNLNYIKREVTYENSRFDIYFERTNNKKGFIEIKGVTLEEEGVVKFPDAPSKRAIKHIKELIKAKNNNYEAYIIFIIQMKNVNYFRPNVATHKEFSEVLNIANNKGVKILAYDCFVSSKEIYLKDKVKIIL